MQARAVEQQLLELLGDLVAIPSTFPPGDTSRIAAHCRDFLSGCGFAVDVREKRSGVQNVVARTGKGAPSLVFNAHADTVDVGERTAWRTDPWKATLVDGRVYGLGACNCKSSMAVHLWLAREVARRGGPKRGELVFTFVGDEENLGSDGLAFLRERSFVKPDILVVAAQTANRLVLEERGVMWVRATTRGRAAHAGAPHTGDSAILRMNAVISEIRSGLLPEIQKRKSASGQQSTLSIGKIRGGENTNVVPDACTIEIDRRILPDENFEGAFEELKTFLLKSGAAKVELLTGTAGFAAREGGAAVTAFGEAIAQVTKKPPARLNVVGASDARYFARDGIEIVVFGPGDGADSHKPNESVALAEMAEAALIQLAAIERLLG
ncbi:MAG TPA: ArgE/DapE family deacylase [Burkholderiales bacterium]|nr:ArgE/DapE family deacylase [Burkholderiales bacterium]